MKPINPKSPHQEVLTMEKFESLLFMLHPSENPEYAGGTIEWHTANDFFQAVKKMYEAAQDLLDNEEEWPTERYDKLWDTLVPLTEWRVSGRDK